MKGAATATAVGAGISLALYLAVQSGMWLFDVGARSYSRFSGWRESRQASKENG